MKTKSQFSRYVREKLATAPDLCRYIEPSSVLITGRDPQLVIDIMVVVPNRLFPGFRKRFGDCYVANDHGHTPPIFTRFKSHEWLRSDFSRRLPIALWIFRNAVILQDPHGAFRELLAEREKVFRGALQGIILQKYTEFRSERHNLRQAVWHRDGIAIDLIRATVVKLALEIMLLAHGNPYPYKKWLASEVKRLGKDGVNLTRLSQRFLAEVVSEEVIALSDEVVALIVNKLVQECAFKREFLDQWWLHLK